MFSHFVLDFLMIVIWRTIAKFFPNNKVVLYTMCNEYIKSSMLEHLWRFFYEAFFKYHPMFSNEQAL